MTWWSHMRFVIRNIVAVSVLSLCSFTRLQLRYAAALVAVVAAVVRFCAVAILHWQDAALVQLCKDS